MNKKITVYAMAILLSLTCLPLQSFAEVSPTSNHSVTLPQEKEAVQMRGMMLRLNQINTMDKSGLSSKEKRALRKEVKTIDKAMKAAGNGVYISTGAIIIIIILLIILL